MSEPREYTQEEMMEKLLRHMWVMVDWWAKENRPPNDQPREKLIGLMHSFLCIFDGCTMEIPTIELIPMPHEDDEQYHKDNSSNWWPRLCAEDPLVTTIHGNNMIHDFMFELGRKWGFIPEDKEQPPLPTIPKELARTLKDRYASEDLDDHVHELKSHEAAAINNAGIDDQLEYLYEQGGEEWLKSALLEEHA